MTPKTRSQSGITYGGDAARTIIEFGGFTRAQLHNFHIPAVFSASADEGGDKINYAKVLQAVYGQSEDEFADAMADERRRRPPRPHVFETKGYYRNVPSGAPDHTVQLIDESTFAELYAAAEFAEEHELWFDTTITLNWSLLGAGSEAEKAFEAFMKCLREWWPSGMPLAFIYAHERGPDAGLHTHIALFASPSMRRALREWAMGWVKRRSGREVKKAVRVRTQKTTQPWLHWVTVSYLLKGYDPKAVIVSARNAPDGRAVYLGDIIAAPWRNPGLVPFKKRTGTSASLKPGARKNGIPNGVGGYPARTRWVYRPISLFLEVKVAKVPAEGQLVPFRSKYEDGIRDVRQLYPREFLEKLRHDLSVGQAPCALTSDGSLADLMPEGI